MLEWFKNLFKRKVVQLPALPNQLPEAPSGERELPEEGHTGQVKLGVIVGHSKLSEGARMRAPYFISEYAYNLEIAKMMKQVAPEGMLIEIVLRDGKKGDIVRAYDEARAKLCDCVIELHFNAATGTAAGTETLCSPDLSDVDFAHIVHRSLVKLLNREGKLDRGVKTISKSVRGGINVHSFPGGVNCLVEPFFGDNFEDAKLGMDKRTLYAKCLVDAVVLWARKVDLLK